MATNRIERAAMAHEAKKKILNIHEDEYHQLVKDSIRLAAALRLVYNGGVWDGTSDDFDDLYDAECLAKLPSAFMD